MVTAWDIERVGFTLLKLFDWLMHPPTLSKPSLSMTGWRLRSGLFVGRSRFELIRLDLVLNTSDHDVLGIGRLHLREAFLAYVPADTVTAV